MHSITLPITRYYGSKRKIIDEIWEEIEKENIEFDSILDVFGGSGIFSYYAKFKHKQVFYNDIFKFNKFIGTAIIEQKNNPLTIERAINLLKKDKSLTYEYYVKEHYKGIYFTDQENELIDIFVQNILKPENKDILYSGFYVLIQSCLIKRPFNLFHRKNLNLRLNHSKSNFGNKITWERSFEELFERFVKELDLICFDNKRINKAHSYSALNCPLRADLVYIDPPYFSKTISTSYHNRYHFLEGLVNYHLIPSSIDLNKKNKEIMINSSEEFENKHNFLHDLQQLIKIHKDSHVVISYRNNGIPTIKEIEKLLLSFNHINLKTIDLGQYNYALSKSNSINKEYLFICKNKNL